MIRDKVRRFARRQHASHAIDAPSRPRIEGMDTPDTDTSEYAALVEFAATSGRSRIHPAVVENADKLITRFWSARAQAMTQALAAMAKAATQRSS
jgi:hypothetical protein